MQTLGYSLSRTKYEIEQMRLEAITAMCYCRHIYKCYFVFYKSICVDWKEKDEIDHHRQFEKLVL